jgi:hypothetical protein
MMFRYFVTALGLQLVGIFRVGLDTKEASHGRTASYDKITRKLTLADDKDLFIQSGEEHDSDASPSTIVPGNKCKDAET